MRPLILLLKAVLSVTILAVLLTRISADQMLARVSAAAPAPLAAALLGVLVMYVLIALRWRLVARTLGLALPPVFAIRAVFLGLFGGQVLPTGVGTDLVRGWAAAQQGGSVRAAASSVVADRLVALVGACLLVALCVGALGDLGLPFAFVLLPAALLGSAAVLVAFLWLCKASCHRSIAGALLIALVVHALGVLVAAMTAGAYGIDASLRTWFAIIPPAIIVIAVPVSLNGWGVREAAIVALGTMHGVAPADALVVSITLGLLNMAASLPGGYLMLARDAS